MSEPALVIDPGSFSIKAGLSTDDVPHIIRSVVGRSRLDSDEVQRPYVGDCALANRRVTLTDPISEGQIDDISDFELLVDFVYSLLKTADSSTPLPVVLAEPAFNSAPNREKLAELFFEKYQIPQLNITLQGILSLVGTGRVTGLVLDCGHGGCQTVPIFESYVIPHSIESLRLGGRDLDVLLAKLLALQNVRLAKTEHKDLLRKIKHQMCYCRKSPDSSITGEPMDFKLPDGQTISMAEERFIVPEAFFSPTLVGAEGAGLAAMVANSIKNSPIDLTRPLVSNIILAGGSSLFPGFAQRLSAEVKFRVTASMAREVKVIASEDRQLTTWNGGKAFADLRDSFAERWMTKEEYLEHGAEFVHSKVMGQKMN